MRVPRTVWDHGELFKTSEKFIRLLGTIWDIRELFKTSENGLKIS